MTVDEIGTQEAPPTERKRGRKKGQVIQKRPDLPDEAFETFVYVKPEDRVLHKRRREERSEKQKAIDTTVAECYQEWVDSGMPANWADMPIISWVLPAQHVDTAEFMLRKAAALYGRKITWGHRENETDDFGNETGRVILPFCVIARVKKPSANGSSE